MCNRTSCQLNNKMCFEMKVGTKPEKRYCGNKMIKKKRVIQFNTVQRQTCELVRSWCISEWALIELINPLLHGSWWHIICGRHLSLIFCITYHKCFYKMCQLICFILIIWVVCNTQKIIKMYVSGCKLSNVHQSIKWIEGSH